MKFDLLRSRMRGRLVFRPEDLHAGRPAPAFERVQFSQWVKDQKLLRLKRGVYTLPPEEHAGPISALSLAEPLYRPSYISLAWALSGYGLIPEAVGSLTCVTTLKTARFQNPFGTFLYQHVDPRYFFGFVHNPGADSHWLALPEKALLDFIYLAIPAKEPLTDVLFMEGYRFQNLNVLSAVKLKSFLRRFKRPRVQRGGGRLFFGSWGKTMIDALRAYLSSFSSELRLNVLREYIQWLILQSLDEGGCRPHLIFTGGTCLRVVYRIQRFSEDLDFSLAPTGKLHMHEMRSDLLTRLKRRGLEVEISSLGGEGRAVGSFWVRFINLLHPLGLSSQRTQKLSIKFEVDMNPPSGGSVEEHFRPEPIPFLVNHFDLPSLFSTKIHALLFRGFDKGRDYYDLQFFLGREIIPNWKLFQNAVRQTHPNQSFPSLATLWFALQNKIEGMDEERIIRDVRPFLLKPEEERFLTKKQLLKGIQKVSLGSK